MHFATACRTGGNSQDIFQPIYSLLPIGPGPQGRDPSFGRIFLISFCSRTTFSRHKPIFLHYPTLVQSWYTNPDLSICFLKIKFKFHCKYNQLKKFNVHGTASAFLWVTAVFSGRPPPKEQAVNERRFPTQILGILLCISLVLTQWGCA